MSYLGLKRACRYPYCYFFPTSSRYRALSSSSCCRGEAGEVVVRGLATSIYGAGARGKEGVVAHRLQR